MAKVRGGPAVKPSKGDLTAYKRRGKKPGKGSAQSYFPSADLTPGDMAAILRNSQSQVKSTYSNVPLPDLAKYQQPFVDAAARESKLGTDMLAAIGGAAQYSQGLTQGLSSWVQNASGQAQQQAQAAGAPGGVPVPTYTTAAQTAIPIQSMGTSQTQYLNALAPYVVGSAQQYQQNIRNAQTSSLKDYNTAAEQRKQDIAKDTQTIYGKNLDAATTARQNVTKNAIAEYIALTTGGMKAKDAAEKVRVDTARIIHDQTMALISQQNADASTQRAQTGAYKATHPAASTAGKSKKATDLRMAKQSAFKAFNTKLGSDSTVSGYDHMVTISYTPPPSGFGGASQPKTIKIPISSATQDINGTDLQAAIKAWIQKNIGRYPGAKAVGVSTGRAQKTPGVVTHYGPGKGTNWQNAVTAYATYFQPQAGETPAEFRKRMAAAVAAFLPRPKAK